MTLNKEICINCRKQQNPKDWRATFWGIMDDSWWTRDKIIFCPQIRTFQNINEILDSCRYILEQTVIEEQWKNQYDAK